MAEILHIHLVAATDRFEDFWPCSEPVEVAMLEA
jgi:hypothetical protein